MGRPRNLDAFAWEGVPKTITPPKTLVGRVETAAYRAAVRHLGEQQLWSPRFSMLLELLAVAWAKYQHAVAMLREESDVIHGRINPWHKIYEIQARDCTRYLKDLGLTPQTFASLVGDPDGGEPDADDDLA